MLDPGYRMKVEGCRLDPGYRMKVEDCRLDPGYRMKVEDLPLRCRIHAGSGISHGGGPPPLPTRWIRDIAWRIAAAVAQLHAGSGISHEGGGPPPFRYTLDPGYRMKVEVRRRCRYTLDPGYRMEEVDR